MWTSTHFQIAWFVCCGNFPRKSSARDNDIDRRRPFSLTSDRPMFYALFFLHQLQWRASAVLLADFYESPGRVMIHGDSDDRRCGNILLQRPSCWRSIRNEIILKFI